MSLAEKANYNCCTYRMERCHSISTTKPNDPAPQHMLSTSSFSSVGGCQIAYGYSTTTPMRTRG